jgi:peptidoglycan/xylan/chitin deacetylase (PgdA/CDA1 family)
MIVRALSLLMAMLTLGAGASAHAKKKHVAARAAAPRHHERFEGGGTGGDSPKPESGGPELLLTFDDGPALANTPKVLDLLDQHGYKAVFFVCGNHFIGKSPSAEKARELLREIVRRGHAVGNHTIHHLFLCSKTGAEKAVEEIEGNGKLIAEALGEPPYLFRTPYGAHCPTLTETLRRIGVRPIGWDIDPQDWRLKNAPKIEASVKAALRNLTGRAILLLHDVQPATIVALPKILDFIDQENERRTKVAQAPIKVISYDYLLAAKPAPPAKKAPGEEALLAVAQRAGEMVAPIARWMGVSLPAPAPPAPPPSATP